MSVFPRLVCFGGSVCCWRPKAVEGKASLCFSSRSCVLPFPLWPMARVSWTWSHISWPCDTYDKICFLGSGGMYLVVSAVFLQHTFLSCDSRQKGQMQKRNGGKAVDERQLFHGTSTDLVDAICQQNFDWRVCGLHGTSYGKGKGKGILHQHNQASLHYPGLRKPF